jgi:sec-independent protein translocase protein TatC
MPELVAEPQKSNRQVEQEQMATMGLLQHLEELRQRVFYSVIAVGVCFGVSWYKWDAIYALMRAPIEQALKAHNLPTKLNFVNPTDPFNLSLKLALITGIFIACPFLLYQVWMFISPGLYRKEKRFVLPFLFMSVGLFLSGGFFGYKVVFPVALDFLIKTGADAGMQPMITITEYTDLFLTILLGLALIFELPIVLGFAGAMGVVSPKFLLKHIRGAVLICFVVAAILTPTTDMMNMTIYAAPMILLYILSIGVVWLVHPKQRRARKEKSAQKDQ